MSAPRLAALKAINGVLLHGESLSQILPPLTAGLTHAGDRALARELAYGVLRWRLPLEHAAAHLLQRPPKRKDRDILHIILLGIYQLTHMRIADHAAVAETVGLCAQIGKGWAKGLVNAVLRNHQRTPPPPTTDEGTLHSHPAWLIEHLQRAWPAQWPEIVSANNAHPPMWLRVNRRQGDRAAYLQALAEAGIGATPHPWDPLGLCLLQAVDVEALPGFRAGRVSVQDGAPQLCGGLLGLGPGQRILDACAAPGGKTGQILELAPAGVTCLALDKDPRRLERVRDNLARLDLKAEVRAGDATRAEDWHQGMPYDRILLDAPCSATGVIRRHPDIKWLRSATDIDGLAQQQADLLEALWPLLAPGGQFLYATCSILPRENSDQIGAFLGRHADAMEIPIDVPWGFECTHGRQILPGHENMDGFYFARLRKQAGEAHI